MIVPDASVLIAALLRLDGAPRIQARLHAAATPFHIPEFADLEVLNGVRRLLVRGEASGVAAEAARTGYSQLPLRRYQHGRLLDRAWMLRNIFPAYDAVYVALAEALAAPLLTRDSRLARAARNVIEVELL